MKYIAVVLLILFCACKENNKTKTTVKNEGFPQHKEALNEINIAVCAEGKRDIALYKEFIAADKISFKEELGNQLYYNAQKTAFGQLFQTKNIDCIVPVSGGRYTIFDIYYSDYISAVNIYDAIIGLNQKREDAGDYHDFFKRGLVFILDSEQNKLTMLTFDPFADNALPAEIAAYFDKNKLKYERVVRIVGLGYVKVLVD